MHDLTLLIQLFGREVMDSLLHAGFETNEAIARAGPERVSQDSSIPLPLARRIVAVAMESQALDEQEPPVPPPAARKPARARRPTPDAATHEHVRRPLRRPHSALAAVAGDRPDDAPADPDAAEAKDDPPPTPLDHDTFIDDAGLVTWMGFSARTGSGRMISVADAILDPRAPRLEPADTAPLAAAPPIAAIAPVTAAPVTATAPVTTEPVTAVTTAPITATPATATVPKRHSEPAAPRTEPDPEEFAAPTAPLPPPPVPAAFLAPVPPPVAPRTANSATLAIPPLRPQAAKPQPAAPAAAPRQIAGSFWGFGAPRPSSPGPSAPSRQSPAVPAGGTAPRRRSSDEP